MMGVEAAKAVTIPKHLRKCCKTLFDRQGPCQDCGEKECYHRWGDKPICHNCHAVRVEARG
ncbi:unnamed protein product [marine sediment metagenome]|uniref:Uncharacterized protein n=1 Tax=marine sediment metagenome TaxID=412755 RepID=X0XUB7_9ZZZZ